MIVRWLRFNAVGLAGVVVQLTVLSALIRFAGTPVLIATALAVEAAILHNFYWHEKWTWATAGTPGWASRLVRFHLTNGAVSIFSNLVWMHTLVKVFHVHYLIANLLSIGATSLLNFALSEWIVFRRKPTTL